MSGITQGVAEFVIATTFQDLPADVVAKSKDMMLNAAAVGLAGSREPEGRIMAGYVQKMGGVPVSGVLGAGIRTSPVNAALANGTMVHVLDYDEHVQRRANHPSNVLFPTVMALGQELSLPGSKVLEAFTLGCEVSTKVGAAGDFDELRPRMWHYGWHLDGVAGTIGAAAAAGKLYGLDQEQMENALGIAVTQSSGVQSSYGTSCKAFQCGQAAMNGIMAATLAQQGFTGPRTGIEHPKGFFGCYRRSTDVDSDAFLAQLGDPYDIIYPGVGLKLHPCASLTAASLDAMLRLIREHALTSDNVRAIHVSLPPDEAKQCAPFARPRSGLQAKFSVNYCAAVALVHGAPRIHHFTDEAITDERVLAVLDRVVVEGTEIITPEVSRPATVTVTLAGGGSVAHRNDFPAGHPTNPLTVEQLDDKFRYCATGSLSAAATTTAIDGFRRMEVLDDVASLFASLEGDGAGVGAA